MVKLHSCTKKFDDGHVEVCMEKKDFTLWHNDDMSEDKLDLLDVCGFLGKQVEAMKKAASA